MNRFYKVFNFIFLTIFTLQINAQDFQWANGIGGGGVDMASDIVATSQDIYITGQFSGTVDFDPSLQNAIITSNGMGDAFVAKYSEDGLFRWVMKIGGDSTDFGNKLVVGPFGVYVIGEFQEIITASTAQGDIDLGTITEPPATRNHDVFFARLDKVSGSIQWIHAIRSDAFNLSGDIALDDAGNLYITGSFGGDIVQFDFTTADSISLAPAGADIFLAKYTTNGSFTWAKNFGGNDFGELGTGLSIDNLNNVYLSGEFSGTIDVNPAFETEFLTSIGAQDAFVARFNSQGEFQWARKFQK